MQVNSSSCSISSKPIFIGSTVTPYNRLYMENGPKVIDLSEKFYVVAEKSMLLKIGEGRIVFPLQKSGEI